jgi:hypothetical protein
MLLSTGDYVFFIKTNAWTTQGSRRIRLSLARHGGIIHQDASNNSYVTALIRG